MLNFDYYIIQGATLQSNIVARDVNQNLINLSGYSAAGRIKNRYSSTGILLDLQPTISPEFTGGLILINISSTGTATLPFGQFVYDINISNSIDNNIPLMQGKVFVSPNVSPP